MTDRALSRHNLMYLQAKSANGPGRTTSKGLTKQKSILPFCRSNANKSITKLEIFETPRSEQPKKEID